LVAPRHKIARRIAVHHLGYSLSKYTKDRL
jgi:hypothetical protein